MGHGRAKASPNIQVHQDPPSLYFFNRPLYFFMNQWSSGDRPGLHCSSSKGIKIILLMKTKIILNTKIRYLKLLIFTLIIILIY